MGHDGTLIALAPVLRSIGVVFWQAGAPFTPIKGKDTRLIIPYTEFVIVLESCPRKR
jgi:hypothetical protein